MSKAYDRIECGFLEGMLQALGFPANWVTIVMECVSSVRYKIKVNGYLTDSLKPQMCLRQGDPISPYLFIICAGWLSRKIYDYQVSNRLQSIKVCRGAPPITHLFFADDNIFFCKENVSNAGLLVNVLREYQSISGMKNNLAKSEVVFSKNVDMVIRSTLMDILGIQ